MEQSTLPTLVFGDDRTAASDVAWLWINNQRWPGWRLEVVSAHPPEIGQSLPPERTRLHPWDPPVPRHPFVEAGFEEAVQLVAESDPRLVLSRSSDLLVIGPRGPGLAKSLHLGSTADWLLNRPPAPLVIVRKGDPMSSVVLCIDGSDHAKRATEVLAELPIIDQLSVLILAVEEHRSDLGVAVGAATDRLEAAGASVTSSIVEGKPTNVILSYIEGAEPDLVALGTRGLTGLRRLRVGSTAGAVVRTASCSVLVTSAEDEPEN